MAKRAKAKTVPPCFVDVDQLKRYKAAIKDRREGMSLHDVSTKHYRVKTYLPAALRKCRDVVDNPDASKDAQAVAKRILDLWNEASSTGGKRVGGAPAKMTVAKSKELLAALKDC